MVTIPIKGLTPQENEELKTILLSMFIEVEDNRLISIMTKAEVEGYVNLLVEDTLCETLYDMLSVFGEEDFITLIKPVVSLLAASDYNTDTYLTLVKDKIEEIL